MKSQDLIDDEAAPVALYKKWSSSLRNSSVNATKSTGNYGFGHISWRNP